jgi:hypothetical protein
VTVAAEATVQSSESKPISDVVNWHSFILTLRRLAVQRLEKQASDEPDTTAKDRARLPLLKG